MKNQRKFYTFIEKIHTHRHPAWAGLWWTPQQNMSCHEPKGPKCESQTPKSTKTGQWRKGDTKGIPNNSTVETHRAANTANSNTHPNKSTRERQDTKHKQQAMPDRPTAGAQQPSNNRQTNTSTFGLRLPLKTKPSNQATNQPTAQGEKNNSNQTNQGIKWTCQNQTHRGTAQGPLVVTSTLSTAASATLIECTSEPHQKKQKKKTTDQPKHLYLDMTLSYKEGTANVRRVRTNRRNIKLARERGAGQGRRRSGKHLTAESIERSGRTIGVLLRPMTN